MYNCPKNDNAVNNEMSETHNIIKITASLILVMLYTISMHMHIDTKKHCGTDTTLDNE